MGATAVKPSETNGASVGNAERGVWRLKATLRPASARRGSR
jgi:hypothetical protein